MLIDIDILSALGGIQKKYNKKEVIFSEGEHCRFYYKIMDGAV
jgi:hypothetical protein